MFGFLNIYKPVGMTSHDVVAVLRRITKIRQIGHTGTLDPFAEGVLPICIGKATRLIEFLKDEKEYLATIQFGASTDTYDLDGEKVQYFEKKVDKKLVEDGLKAFMGEIEQFPPIYSAIKVNGKKLYEYARNGENVEIKPRKVKIENIELKSFDEDKQQAEVLIKCSKGTYIRSIANDLGKKLECGGFLVKLIRTQAGMFRIEDSIKLDDINVESNLINPITKLDLPIIDINSEDLKKVKNGIALNLKEEFKHDFVENCEKFVLLTYNKTEICAIGCIKENLIKIKKVFV